ncbi:MAG: hypothetical protein LC749_16365 [Actinobacteria bacterium]|nr:hypothetical protein [Actinomycetota bacterium]
MGNNSTADARVFVPVASLAGVVSVAGGYTHSAAVLADGTVRAWGANGFGQLGNNSTAESHVPVAVSGLSAVSAVSAGFFHTVALKADGSPTPPPRRVSAVGS